MVRAIGRFEVGLTVDATECGGERDTEKQGERERGADSGRHSALSCALRDGDGAELEERNHFLRRGGRHLLHQLAHRV